MHLIMNDTLLTILRYISEGYVKRERVLRKDHTEKHLGIIDI